MNAPLPPAGWYPDPSGKPGMRYFDGKAWTDAPPPTPKKRVPTWVIVVGVILGIIVLGSAFGGSHNNGSSSPSTSSRTTVAAPTSETLSPEEIQRQQQEQERQRQLEAQRLDPSTYNAISPHDYAVLLKDPDAHKGEKIIVYRVVTQFDTATGDSEFRADTVAEPHDGADPQNTMIEASDRSILTNVVKGDDVQMYVKVDGTETYKATLGADRTVPKFDVNIINVTGSSQ